MWRKYQKLEVLNIIFIALYYGTCFIIFLTAKSNGNYDHFTLSKLFRSDSKYRMMFSCICAEISSLCGVPFIVNTFTHNFNFRLEVTREAIMSISYYMVYIDQILKAEQNGGQAFHSLSNDYSDDNISYKKNNYTTKSTSKTNDTSDYGAQWNSFDDKKSFIGYNNYNNY